MTALRNANPHVVTDDGPNPAEGRWSQVEMLLASAVDELRYLRYDARISQGDKKAKLPDPIRRPGVKASRDKQRLTAEQYDWLFQHINGIASEDEFTDVNVAMKPVTRPEP
jgi:hypothetical protein